MLTLARKLAVQPELFLVGEAEDGIVASMMAGYEGHRGWVNYLAVAAAFHDAMEFYRRLRYVEDESVSLGKRLIDD